MKMKILIATILCAFIALAQSDDQTYWVQIMRHGDVVSRGGLVTDKHVISAADYFAPGFKRTYAYIQTMPFEIKVAIICPHYDPVKVAEGNVAVVMLKKKVSVELARPAQLPTRFLVLPNPFPHIPHDVNKYNYFSYNGTPVVQGDRELVALICYKIMDNVVKEQWGGFVIYIHWIVKAIRESDPENEVAMRFIREKGHIVNALFNQPRRNQRS